MRPADAEKPRVLFECFVPGTPKPKGAVSAFAYQDAITGKWKARVVFKRQVAYEKEVKHYLATRRGRGIGRDCPVHVELRFVLPRPKNADLGDRRFLSGYQLANKRPDIDKLSRTILDAMTDIVYHDDQQVVSLHASKRVADLDEPSGVHIVVSSASGALWVRPTPETRRLFASDYLGPF